MSGRRGRVGGLERVAPRRAGVPSASPRWGGSGRPQPAAGPGSPARVVRRAGVGAASPAHVWFAPRAGAPATRGLRRAVAMLGGERRQDPRHGQRAGRVASVAVLVVLTLTAAGSVAGADGKQVITRHFTQRDQQVSRYVYVPFDAPKGTTRITVSYRYDRRDGTNVVDLGLFEPGRLTLGTPNYRGWSGGERNTITIALDEATPGYWPGPPIPEGEWNVMLGLYKVSRDGVDVEVTVETVSGPSVDVHPMPAGRAAEPIRRGPDWYVGVLHAHTNHSDGALPPQQLADKARSEKLDFLAITDHNNTTHVMATVEAPGLLLIDGEEVTTPGGHFNVFGLGPVMHQFVDFRVLPGDPAIHDLVFDARRRGFLVSINHPVSNCLACTWTHPVPEGVDAMELSDEGKPVRLESITMWDTLLRQGRRITAIATSDWHRGDAPLGRPTVRVFADQLSGSAILQAVRAGHVVVLADATLPAPVLTVRAAGVTAGIGDQLEARTGDTLFIDLQAPAAYSGARVDLLWNGEVIASNLVPAGGGTTSYERYANARGYLRVHIVAADGTILAVTNPVFLDVAQ